MATSTNINRERIEKQLDELTLFDDDLMSRVFDENIEATNQLLRWIFLQRMKKGYSLM